LGERPHSTFKRMMTRHCNGYPQRWNSFVPQVCLAMRTRIHSTTRYSPFYLVYGVEPRLPGDHLPYDLNDFSNLGDPVEYTNRELEALGAARGAAHLRTQAQAESMKKRYDRQEKVKQFIPFQIGEYVKKRNHDNSKYQYRWLGPLIVVSIGPNDTYRLMLPSGRILDTLIHHDELAPYTSSQTEGYITNVENTLNSLSVDHHSGGISKSEGEELLPPVSVKYKESDLGSALGQISADSSKIHGIKRVTWFDEDLSAYNSGVD
jgi:hypothetical protein